MTAGTVVITGGILATVILLCIIAVLCYCRLQYYCCKKNGSDSGSISQQHFACNARSVPGLDGSIINPLSLSPPEPPAPSNPSKIPGGRHGYCPSCSPYNSPFYIRTTDEMRNGGERITFMPTHYDNQALAMPLPAVRGTLLRDARRERPSEIYTNTQAISTEV
ncbi:protein FAM163A-like [Gouania willdenowi]|uniref:Protein FAM163A-like n=1 Tax=Gouania willdenowi TaxID=441366 RepID=A0A8C5I7J0_GOUWI|nr:protein FAM163A-like [Gouania willdenowi]XP_028301482.1 protein FAM163A-like [Gouania willdenowi]